MTIEPFNEYDGAEEVEQYLIRNKRSGGPLARIVYYGSWRQYIMEPAGSGIMFNNQCLRDIAVKLDALNATRHSTDIGE